MSETNTWSSAAWFKAAKTHASNLNSCLPTANKQTGITFVITAGAAGSYLADIPALKIPGQIAAMPVQLAKTVGDNTIGKVVEKIGEREAVVQKEVTTLPSKSTFNGYVNLDESGKPVTNQIYKSVGNDQWGHEDVVLPQDDISGKVKSGEMAPSYVQNHTTTTTPEVKNNQTKDWKTVEKFAGQASSAAANVATGIVLHSLSTGVTTAGNSLLEGKGVSESLGDGVHATKNSLENTFYGIAEGLAAAFDFTVGSGLLVGEGVSFACGKIWGCTLGQLPHDEAPVVAGGVDEAQEA